MSLEYVNISDSEGKFGKGFNRKACSYCWGCGKEYNSNVVIEKCNMCNGNILKGHMAEIIGGYVDLSRRGELKNYYYKVMKGKVGKVGNGKSEIRMNEKRLILYLLVHKDMIIGYDNEKVKILIDKIFMCRRKRNRKRNHI